jgi:hypothetical protein
MTVADKLCVSNLQFKQVQKKKAIQRDILKNTMHTSKWNDQKCSNN